MPRHSLTGEWSTAVAGLGEYSTVERLQVEVLAHMHIAN